MKRNEVARLAGLICVAVLATATSGGAQSTAGSQGTPQTPGTPGTPAAPGTTTPGTTGSTTTTGTQETGGASSTGTQSGDKASGADKKFVKEAAQGGLAEVQLGQLAAQKGNSEDVKQFGQKMTEDHGKLNEQMKPVAQQLGINPPTTLDAKHKALQTKLEGLSGEAFDKAYIQAMVKDHEKDSAEFQKEATNGKSQAVKDVATQGAPIISEHLRMIQKIAQDHGLSNGQTAATTNPR
jgi:putative membrane protein